MTLEEVLTSTGGSLPSSSHFPAIIGSRSASYSGVKNINSVPASKPHSPTAPSIAPSNVSIHIQISVIVMFVNAVHVMKLASFLYPYVILNFFCTVEPDLIATV